jgi:hypothetical protein
MWGPTHEAISPMRPRMVLKWSLLGERPGWTSYCRKARMLGAYLTSVDFVGASVTPWTIDV